MIKVNHALFANLKRRKYVLALFTKILAKIFEFTVTGYLVDLFQVRKSRLIRTLCSVELVILLHVHPYSVHIFSYSGPSGILGSDGK